MTSIDQAGTFTLGDRVVKRLGYGAMQLAGPGVFGPPRDPVAARRSPWGIGVALVAGPRAL
jgi:pyridoxine 4-dehydrogenase